MACFVSKSKKVLEDGGHKNALMKESIKMIHTVSIKCPDCGAALDIESTRDTAYCTYCGAKIKITYDNEIVVRHIDDAEIKRAETERIVRLRELDIKESKLKKRKSSSVSSSLAIALLIGLALIFFLFIKGFVIIGVFVIVVEFAIVCMWLAVLLEQHEDEKKGKDKGYRL